MIGIIYTINLVEQKEKKHTALGGHGTAFFNTSADDIIALFPDFNKRLQDIGIESP